MIKDVEHVLAHLEAEEDPGVYGEADHEHSSEATED